MCLAEMEEDFIFRRKDPFRRENEIYLFSFCLLHISLFSRFLSLSFTFCLAVEEEEEEENKTEVKVLLLFRHAITFTNPK